jgi:hypothetical protein
LVLKKSIKFYLGTNFAWRLKCGTRVYTIWQPINCCGIHILPWLFDWYERVWESGHIYIVSGLPWWDNPPGISWIHETCGFVECFSMCSIQQGNLIPDLIKGAECDLFPHSPGLSRYCQDQNELYAIFMRGSVINRE